MTKTFAAAASAAIAFFAVPAAAEQHAVKYADLDLTTDAGMNELDRRIDKVARKICAMDEDRSGSRLSSRKSTDCLEKARASTKQEVAKARGANSVAG